jgi:hypothetical protein
MGSAHVSTVPGGPDLPSPPARLYRRESIPGDREIEPLRLTGAPRAAFLALHVGLTAFILGGLAYVLYLEPLFGLTALVLGYFFENRGFVRGHLQFHAAFIEMPEEKMPTLIHHSLIHHYKNVRIFHETWLETRVSYFVEPRSLFASLAKISVGFALVAAFCYVVDPVLGIGMFAARAFWLLVQSIIHEWYHNPVKNRKSFYTVPVYWFLTALEKAGLASTRGHARHHRHTLDDLDHVDRWLDLAAPFERIGERKWAAALELYEPGKTNMSDYLAGGVFGVPPNLIEAVCYVVLTAGAFLLLVG